MTGYVDLEAMMQVIFFRNAVADNRFVWQEIIPNAEIAEVVEISGADMGLGVKIKRTEWADSEPRYRITGCAHLESYRDGKLCTFCGHANPYEPEADEAARKNPEK